MGHIISKTSRSVGPENAPNPLFNHFIRKFVGNSSLSSETYELLVELQERSDEDYDKLIQSLGQIVNPNKPPKDVVYIKACHFDMAAEVLQMQRSLPVDVEGTVSSYLQKNSINIRRIIQKLREDKLPEIAYQSQRQNSAQHSLMHALEVKVRVMAIVTEDLKIYCSDSDFDVFMRNIIAFAVECHDLVQGASAAGDSTVEKLSADLVLGWLNSEEGLGSVPVEIMRILRYQIYYLVPIATTIAFSVNKPLDLTRLLNLFEKHFIKAGIPIYQSNNKRFCKVTKLIAHIVGCIDTIPYAMLQSNIRQSSLSTISSTAMLVQYKRVVPYQKMCFGESGIINRFMSANLKKYYSKNVTEEVDFQAFLTGLVSKLGMRVELANGDELHGDYALLLGTFIRNMQHHYLNVSNLNNFLRYLDREFDENLIGNAVDILLMREEKIQAEIDFVNSNYDRACLVNLYIREYIDSEVVRCKQNGIECTIQNFGKTIIEPKAIRADAENIQNFFSFYQDLSIQDKLRLLKELTLNLVLQAGTNYIKYPSEEHLLDPQQTINFPDLSAEDNYVVLSIRDKPGVFTDLVRHAELGKRDEKTTESSSSLKFLRFSGQSDFSADERKCSEGEQDHLLRSFGAGK